MAKGEVVSNGVARVEARKCCGDLFRGFPGEAAATGEAEIPRQAVDVDIDGDEQAGRVDVPEAEVHAVGGTDHPAQEEKEALAAARAARVRQKVRGAATRAVAVEAARVTDGVAPDGQGFAQGVVRFQLGAKTCTK